MPGHYQGPPVPPKPKRKKHQQRPAPHPQDVTQQVPGTGKRDKNFDSSKWGP